jgi:isopropylmalate/homocitrate/citramalate synthase
MQRARNLRGRARRRLAPVQYNKVIVGRQRLAGESGTHQLAAMRRGG